MRAPRASAVTKDRCQIPPLLQRNDLEEPAAIQSLAACVRACVLLHRSANPGTTSPRTHFLFPSAVALPNRDCTRGNSYLKNGTGREGWTKVERG